MSDQRRACRFNTNLFRIGCAASLAVLIFATVGCRGRADTPPVSIDSLPAARTSALTLLARTGWIASASASSSTNVVANAIDASATTRWSTGVNQANGQWFQVDMVQPQAFAEIRLDTTATATDFPRGYAVAVSNDGTTWSTPVASATTNTATLLTIAFAPQVARFVRVTQTGTATNFWSIYDFNVYSTALSRTGWVATASSTGSTNVAGNAIDGSATTRWSSAAAQTGQWFQVDMGSRQTFSQVMLNAGTTTTNFPRGYQLFVSNDGTNFGTAVATGTGTAAFIIINFSVQEARYVRINQTATNTTVWSIQEMLVAGQPTVQTTLPRTGWVASASSTGSTNVAANALDGSATTRWSSVGAQTGQWFQVDMGTYRSFNQITLDAGTTTTNFPRGYQVTISNDGTTFTPIVSGTGTTALVTINLPTQTARYIRVNQTATNTAVWSIQEMNVAGPAVARAGWVATASSTATADPVANALDGSATTRWSTAVAQANGQTFQVDLGTSQTFNQITLDAGTSTGNFPRGYQVFVSADGTNWGTAVATGAGTAQLVTINFLTKTARHVRIVQTATATNVWSIHELNVWRVAQPCDQVTCTALDSCHTVGVCDPNSGVCSNPNATNGTTCNDNNGCTQTDSCQGGVCTGANPKTCTALDQCHVAGVCAPATGLCSNPNATNGATCNDSNACTQTDSCQAGVCTGGNPKTCTALDQCHVAGVCAAATGVCSNPNATNGTGCSDGDSCTQTDSCQSGVCTGTNPKICTALDSCHVAGTCAPSTGACSNPNATNGTSCNDGNACTQTDTCQTGVCTGTNPRTCTGADACHTVAACVPASGCPAPVAKPVGTSCSDGNLCNGSEACTSAGACQVQAGTVVTCTPSQCQASSTCDPTTGQCSASPVVAGTSCNDGNACTTADKCQGTTCTGTTVVITDDHNPCTLETCDPTAGPHPSAPNLTACDDGNSCTATSSCQAGVCQPGPATACTGQSFFAPLLIIPPAPGNDGTTTMANDINDAGVVVGDEAYPGGVRPFRYADGGQVSLFTDVAAIFPTSHAYAVNSAGTAAGWLYAGVGGYTKAANGTVTRYPQLFVANDINDAGLVAGSYDPLANAVQNACLQTPGTLMPTPLPALTGVQFTGASYATAMDNASPPNVVGVAVTAAPSRGWWDVGHAVVYPGAGGVQDLNVLMNAGSTFATLSAAYAVNGSLIAGYGFRTDGTIGAFRYHAGGAVDDIRATSPTFPAGYYQSVATGMNARGDVVGRTFGNQGGASLAFVYTTEGALHNLNEFVDPASGWVLELATAINNNRQVVGYATRQGVQQAFKITLPDLSPCPPPSGQCQGAGTRNFATGICTYAPLTGTPCTDHDACTQPDTCQAGACVSGPQLALDDQNSCTRDSCEPSLGPVHTPISEGAACSDGNRCTVNDSCHVGICQPGAATACAAGTPYYAPLVDLGAFGTELERGTQASGINNSGEVAGNAYFADDGSGGGARVKPFRYTDAGGLVHVLPVVPNCSGCGNAFANAINSSGVVTGQMWGGGAFYSQLPGASPTEYRTYGPSVAFAINDAGNMVGYQAYPAGGGVSQAFRYGPAGFQLLGFFPGPQFNGSTSALGIDPVGRVVGFAPSASGYYYHAFMFTDAAGLQDLNVLARPGGPFGLLLQANAANRDFIVGLGYLPDQTTVRGFRYHQDGTVDSIGTLPSLSNPNRSSLTAINGRGDAVGQADNLTLHGGRAIIYTKDGQLIDLNTFVDPQSGWMLEHASGINDNMEVVGHGLRAGSPEFRAFKIKLPDVTPCPVSANLCQQGTGTRNAATGLCTYSGAPDGTECDDGNASTSVDTCRSGTCWGSVPSYPLTTTYASFTDLGVYDGADSVVAGGLNAQGDVALTETGVRGNTLIRYTGLTRSVAAISILPADSVLKDWYANGIDDAGTVVGSTGWHGEGFLAAAGQPAQIFTGRNGYGNAAAATGGRIAASEPVYTVNNLYAGYVSAFRRDQDGSKHYVGQLQGATAGGGTHTGWTDAIGIGPAGELAGFAALAEGSRTFDNGFVFSPGWGMREAYLFTDPYTGVINRQNLNDYAAASGWQLLYMANATNGSQVVGWGVKENRCRAFRYATGSHNVTDLGTLENSHPGADLCDSATPGQFRYYSPTGINATGEIVGTIAYGGAFYYSDAMGRMVDLQDLIDPALNATLTAASGINDNHEIVGTMVFGSDPRSHAYKLKLPNIVVTPDNRWADIIPQVNGIVDLQDGSGSYVVSFGYDNRGGSEVQLLPGPGTNQVTVNGTTVAVPSPAPPVRFMPGLHAGAFLPRGHAGDTITWTVAGRVVSASIPSAGAGATVLAHVPVGINGFGVNVPNPDDPTLSTFVTIKPNTAIAAEGTPPAGPDVGTDPFHGQLTGQLSVGPTGAAVYTVPIVIPPGIGGTSPNLSLNYNSQRGNSIAGQGWEVGGASMIYRCPKTRGQDGYGKPIEMGTLDSTEEPDPTKRDGLCLDGNRLFQRSNTSFESETNNFSTITLTPETQLFKVVTKSGEIRYYGGHTDSKVTTSGGVVIWALNRVEDVWGNYYDLQYNFGAPTFATNGIILTQIDYTGTKTTQAFYRVRFDYESRTDLRSIRFGAAIFPRNKRLKTITVDAYAVASRKGVYSLTYEPDQPLLPSRLKEINYTVYSPTGAPTKMDPLTFEWMGGGYSWDETPSFASPVSISDRVRSGTQFVDLDGDGRLDFVEARRGTTNAACPNKVWRNNGHGFECAPDSWKLPGAGFFGITEADGSRGQVAFADMDGDGVLDWASQTLKLCDAGNCNVTRPEICLNRIRTGGGWSCVPSTPMPAGWGDLALQSVDSFLDMDGDGRGDIVRISEEHSGVPGPDVVRVLRNVYSSSGGFTWVVAPTLVFDFGGHPVTDYKWEDVNRDGLPDFVGIAEQFPNGTYPIYLNTYPNATAAGGLSSSFLFPPKWQTEPDVSRTVDLRADLDGDGVYDLLRCTSFCFKPNVSMGTGTGYTDQGAAGFNASLAAFKSEELTFENVRFLGFADVNADGLSDLVLSNPTNPLFITAGGAHVLENRGAEWKALNGATSSADLGAPTIPNFVGVLGEAALVDLNGDGVSDLVGATNVRTAWINRFVPPVIKTFPSRMATNTWVSYTVITMADTQTSGTYTDSNTLVGGTKHFTAPMRVVFQTLADNGAGGTLLNQYAYRDLRMDIFGRGPTGFTQMIVTDPSGLKTTTTYAVNFPYTGLETSVTKENQGKISTTETKYCAEDGAGASLGCYGPSPTAIGLIATPGTTFFVHPDTVSDRSYLRTKTFPEETSAEQVLTEMHYVYDTHGNPTQTALTTTRWKLGQKQDAYSKITDQDFGSPGSDEEKMGKVTRATVTTQQLSPVVSDSITHVTAYEYTRGPNIWVPGPALALTKTIVEPGAGFPLELHTAYGYTSLGSLSATTSCDRSFPDCAPGAAGPTDAPFRSTTTSYVKEDFQPPGGSGVITALPYASGRFPVKTTNALGQSEMLAYDPFFGVVTQQTGPNGISTCFEYDDVGQKTSETARCGTSQSFTTTIQRFKVKPQDLPLSALVTVTQPPGGSPTWTYADALGRTIKVVSRGFDGGLVETENRYDALGRLFWSSKPHSKDAPIYFTASFFDLLGRPYRVVELLGPIAAEVSNGSLVVDNDYQGSTVETTRHVGAEARRRAETKNVLGKVILVTDAKGQMSYGYDAEGNLTDTDDGQGHLSHIEYDRRSRKKLSRDPDLGQWAYEYNGYGELVRQTDAKAQSISLNYDVLGRMTTRSDSAGTAKWVYDVASGGVGKLAAVIGAPDTNLSQPCTIDHVGAMSGNRAGRSYAYDGFGELTDTYDCVDGETFRTSYAYDTLGRQMGVRYPDIAGTRQTFDYHYSNSGFLRSISDANGGQLVWAANEVNAAGQVVDELAGNGVQTSWNRNPSTGWLQSSTSTSPTGTGRLVQNWTYQYDQGGSLTRRSRADSVNQFDSEEIFSYDEIDRLHTSEVRVPGRGYDVTETVEYDSIGNITSKAGAGYRYGTCQAGPHALCALGEGAAATYDANGNMLTGFGRTLSYNTANKVVSMDSVATPQGRAAATVTFAYGADGNRVIQTASSGGVTAKTVYVGLGDTGKSMYERTTRGSVVEHAHYLYAGGYHRGGAFALRLVTTETAKPTVTTTNYYHLDHLGSVTAMTDDAGEVADAAWSGADAKIMSYDSWGARRSPDGTAVVAASLHQQPGHREFTGHETIPSVGLVNMNGRVYDPALGRFLTADPHLQFAADRQSYNRYSYVLNNPLRYSDPTGYHLFGNDTGDKIALLGIGVVGVVTCAFSEGIGCGVAFAALSTVVSTTAAISNGVPVADAIGFGVVSFGFGMVLGEFVGEGTSAVFAGYSGGGTQVVNGAIAGAVSAGLTSAAMGARGEGLGDSILEGLMMGALSAGTRAAVRGENVLSVRSAQGGANRPASRMCDRACVDELRKYGAAAGKRMGMDFFTLTGETSEIEGMVVDDARYQKWAAEALQAIFRKNGVPYDRVAATKIYIGTPGDAGSTLALDAIRIPTPGNVPGESFFTTAYSVLHEMGHVRQVIMYGTYGQMQNVWEDQNFWYGKSAYYVPGTLEFDADEFAAKNMSRLLR